MRHFLGNFNWSRLGLTFAGGYFLLTVMAVATALWISVSGDSKGHFVLLQLPIALQLGVLPASVLEKLRGMSWAMAYLIIWPLTLLVLYALGHGIGHILKHQE